MENTLIIRNATQADTESITDNLFLVMEDFFYLFIGKKDSIAAKNLLGYFVQQKQNQYSYQNCLVAEVNNKVVATINSYNGANLVSLREPVLKFIRTNFNNDFNPENETQEGEFYIDSLGVHPYWQGKGIGTELLKQVIAEQYTQKGQTIGLLVDNENRDAKRLYLKLDFKPVGMKTLVGKQLDHLQLRMKLLP